MMSLFPQGGAGAVRNQPWVQFKAGKCVMTREASGDYMVTPDLRKGQVSLGKGDDNLVHLKWTDRSSNTVIDDMIVFHDEVDFKKVNTGRANDRVYMLKWRVGDRRLMFWMQDKSDAKDEENCRKINEYISRPPQEAAGNNNRPQANNSFGLDFANLLRSSAQPAAAAPAPAPSRPTGGLSAEDFQRALQQASGSNAASSAAPSRQGGITDMRRVLNAESILATGILNDPQVRNELLSYLPENQRSSADLEANIRSPQFQQALETLMHALQQGNYNSVIANLGMDPNPGMGHLMRGDAVGAFLAAAAAHGQRQQEGRDGSEEKKDDSSPMEE